MAARCLKRSCQVKSFHHLSYEKTQLWLAVETITFIHFHFHSMANQQLQQIQTGQ
jgi:competence transcription factor ComK